MEVTRNDTTHQIIHELLRLGTALPEEKARALAKTLLAEGEEAVTFFLLEIAMRVKESKPSPSTPSGMIPPYEKVSVQTNKKKRKKKPGGKPGHQGSHRAQPDKSIARKRIDWIGVPIAAALSNDATVSRVSVHASSKTFPVISNPK